MCIYVFPVLMSLYDYLSIFLCAFTWQKIDQAGGPETFFNFVCTMLWFLCSINRVFQMSYTWIGSRESKVLVF